MLKNTDWKNAIYKNLFNRNAQVINLNILILFKS
jgi:hypothetical protein